MRRWWVEAPKSLSDKLRPCLEGTMFRIAFAVVADRTGVGRGAGTRAGRTGPSDSARYTFYRVQDIFLRLDVRTGQVSQCGWDALGWFCRVVPDERAALESEIARLHDRQYGAQEGAACARRWRCRMGSSPIRQSASRNDGGFETAERRRSRSRDGLCRRRSGGGWST